jgi:alpha-tubulin suppressor-like RCC1 family protein
VPPTGLSTVVAIAAGRYFGAALRGDGTLSAWGYYYDASWDWRAMSAPEGLSNVVAISCGADHVLALLDDGTVAAWGRDDQGQTRMAVS